MGGIESRRESRPEDPRDLRREILEGNRRVESLSRQQKEELIAHLEAWLVESEPGSHKAAYRQLLQDIRLSYAGNPGDPGDPQRDIVLDGEYRITTPGQNLLLKSIAYRTIGHQVLWDLGENLTMADINSGRTATYMVLITEENKRCWINLRIIKAAFKDGTHKNYVYIGDRYVAPPLRGKRIGEKLLTLAEDIARANDCSAIFQTLIPENPDDMELLIQGTEKQGYTTTRGENRKVMSVKELS